MITWQRLVTPVNQTLPLWQVAWTDTSGALRKGTLVGDDPTERAKVEAEIRQRPDYQETTR